MVGHRTNEVGNHEPDDAQEVSAHMMGTRFKTGIEEIFEFVVVDSDGGH